MLRDFTIGIRWETKSFIRWTSALFRVAATTYGQSKSMPRRCAIEYVDKVRQNIGGGRFRMYPAYSPIYAKWKASMGLYQKGFWRLHDHLLNSLQTFRVNEPGKYAYMGGVPNGIYAMRISMFGGAPAPKEIAMYGKKAEELRPLFRPVAEEYVRAGYWESQLFRSKRKIKGAWR